MTHEQKIEYLRIALGICTIKSDHETMDLIVSLYEILLDKQEKLDVDSILKIKSEVKNRADIKSRSELLDKVSEKIA